MLSNKLKRWAALIVVTIYCWSFQSYKTETVKAVKVKGHCIVGGTNYASATTTTLEHWNTGTLHWY